MDRLLCAQTSFRFHRVPPQILQLYPPMPSTFQDSNHIKLFKSPIVADLLGTPLHRIARSSTNQGKTTCYRTHVLREELPFGCIQETEHSFSVASPLYTLLTMAPLVSRVELLMAAYELCGTFAVFHPNERTEYLLDSAYRQGFIPLGAGWARVKDARNNETDLWRREPLVTIDELASFAHAATGMHGAKNLHWVARHLTGICASPFEVQASILLGMPRRLGGMGLAISNNERIVLDKQARTIYPRSCCYADIFIAGTEGHPPLDIECQGRLAHASEIALLSDADRLAALESMGIGVLPLTYRQFSDIESYRAAKRLIARKLNMKLRPKTKEQERVEERLHKEVFIDWETLASP